jgi:hypothetical protein
MWVSICFWQAIIFFCWPTRVHQYQPTRKCQQRQQKWQQWHLQCWRSINSNLLRTVLLCISSMMFAEHSSYIYSLFLLVVEQSSHRQPFHCQLNIVALHIVKRRKCTMSKVLLVCGQVYVPLGLLPPAQIDCLSTFPQDLPPIAF